jgi:hypothetical protein
VKPGGLRVESLEGYNLWLCPICACQALLGAGLYQPSSAYQTLSPIEVAAAGVLEKKP